MFVPTIQVYKGCIMLPILVCVTPYLSSLLESTPHQQTRFSVNAQSTVFIHWTQCSNKIVTWLSNVYRNSANNWHFNLWNKVCLNSFGEKEWKFLIFLAFGVKLSCTLDMLIVLTFRMESMCIQTLALFWPLILIHCTLSSTLMSQRVWTFAVACLAWT